MKRILLMLTISLLSITQAAAFCGFYVAKADAKLFNKSSQVILVRSDDRTVITMSNDFKGDVKDFAMVVPVPVILKKNQIRTVAQDIFDRIDSYSAPRMASYYDSNPCMITLKSQGVQLESVMVTSARQRSSREKIKYKGVKIEAKYEVDEYDILILSAKESNGLKNWLNDNDYKIPEKAEEVLDPYIKNGLKFFVAKVNVDRLKKQQSGSSLLSPLQMEFESKRFGLPIRLGMANANGDQDLIIHAYTDRGRVECTNYRTVEMPHDVNVPVFVKDTFGHFYKDVFERSYQQEQGKAVFLEYAWDVSPRVSVKCDPCVGPPPIDQQLATVGCNWLEKQNAQVHYTRLHVRYNRQNFPQDLKFQVTPNKKRFQCRYVITYPANGDMSCPKAESYLKSLVIRREKELNELAKLTGWDISGQKEYVEHYRRMLKEDDRDGYLPAADTTTQTGNATPPYSIWMIAAEALMVLLAISYIRNKTKKAS